ncbi:adenine-specific methyltransferase EcoRI family protein, partial [Patescibacteria group bacterium]|nr:adenine-specific methyltransferase EcoRI family protein [Patescibacteria group bacterium]
QADIVVTNPPFSLFREYVAQLVEHKKKFLILGDQNAVSYKEIFKLIKQNKLWFGYDNNGTKWFQVPDNYDIQTESRKKIKNGIKYFSFGRIMWYTNLDTTKRHQGIDLYKKYSSKEYPKYDNYDAIEVSKVSDIPMDYNGAMGVPVTFLDKYNPEQFEIISSNDIRLNDKVPFKEHGLIKDKDGAINGKPTYVRILIKNKKVGK